MKKEPLIYMEQLEVRLEDLIHGSGPKSVFKVISRIFKISRNTTNQKVKFVVAAKTANQINQLCFMSSILSISIKNMEGTGLEPAARFLSIKTKAQILC